MTFKVTPNFNIGGSEKVRRLRSTISTYRLGRHKV